MKKHIRTPRRIRRLKFTGLLLAVGLFGMLTGCGKIDPALPLDQIASDYLADQGTADAAGAAAALNSIEAERKASLEASLAESRSIAESIAAESKSIADSMAAESLSIAESEYLESLSIAESEYLESVSIAESLYAEYLASSAAESSSVEESLVVESIAESIVAGGEPTGVLTPGKVSTLKESELPKLRSLFADTIIIGHSRARSILDCGLLTTNEVLFKWAASVDEMMDVTVQAAQLYRDKALFILGLNDFGIYKGDVAGFKRSYMALIEAYRAINPNCEIYIQEIIPVNEAYRFRWFNMDRVVDYNAAMREMCEEIDCTFVSSVVYALEEFLVDDGAGVHYNGQYHIYWAQTMANQMNLWEGWQ